MFKNIINIITLLAYINISIVPNVVKAQPNITEHVTVGETTITYSLPRPPDLQLTPPTIFATPPEGARIHPMSLGGVAPYNGILFNGEAAAWLETEHESAPGYISQYGESIRAQMISWTYLQTREMNLQIATEREQSRIRIAGLQREIESNRRLERRNKIRPALITGLTVMILTLTITMSAFYIADNRRN